MKNLDLDLFVVIPADFAITLGRAETANVQVVIDAVDANTAQIAQGYMRSALDDYNATRGAASRVAFRRGERRRAPHIPPHRRALRMYTQPISIIPGW
jgi:hypothetical protein